MSMHPLEARMGAQERRQHDLEVHFEELSGEIKTSIRRLSDDMVTNFKRQAEPQRRLESKIKTHFNVVDIRLNQIDKRFDRVDERFDKVDKRFDQVDMRLNQMDKRFDQVDMRLNQMDKRFEKVDERLDKMDRHFEKVETDLGQMKTMLTQILGRLPGQ